MMVASACPCAYHGETLHSLVEEAVLLEPAASGGSQGGHRPFAYLAVESYNKGMLHQLSGHPETVYIDF